MSGWRRANEDAHICAVEIEAGVHIFGVFDGHGGCEVAKFCEKYIVSELKADHDFKLKNYKEALKNTFIRLDRRLFTSQAQKDMCKINKEATKGQQGVKNK
jgi:protein phosphatase 1G